MKTLFLAIFSILISNTTAAEGLPSKVVILIFENTNYDLTIRQPFFSKVAKEGTLLTNYRGITHPSQPNYIAMTAGDLVGVKGNSNYNLNVNHLADLIEARNLTWKTYADDYPGNCFVGKSKGKYVRKHNPFISYVNIQNNPARCANIVNSNQFESDFLNKKLPNLSLYIPNQYNNAHDTTISYADNWFASKFGPLFQNNDAMKDVMFVITFDEDAGTYNNRIYTALYGPSVISGKQIAVSYDHYSLLRTIQELFDLDSLGKKDLLATPITGFLKL